MWARTAPFMLALIMIMQVLNAHGANSDIQILMADDIDKEISDARDVLQKSGYKVQTANSYDDARSHALEDHYEVAVIDLGWFNDQSAYLKKQGNIEVAGFHIAELVRKKNPNALIIIYSRRVGNADILQTVVRKNMFPINKELGDCSRVTLKNMVSVFAELTEKVSQGQFDPLFSEPTDLPITKILSIFRARDLYIVFSGLIAILIGIASISFKIGRTIGRIGTSND